MFNAFAEKHYVFMQEKQQDKYFHTFSDSWVKLAPPEFTVEDYQNLQLVKLWLSVFSHYSVLARDREGGGDFSLFFLFFLPPTVALLPS